MTTEPKDEVEWLPKLPFPGHYAFCPSRKAWNREMKRLKLDDRPHYPRNDGCCTYFKTPDGRFCAIVTINERFDDGDPVAIMGLLAHEAVHVFQSLAEHAGEDDPSKEFEAYSIQMITQELIWSYLEKRGRKFINKTEKKAA